MQQDVNATPNRVDQAFEAWEKRRSRYSPQAQSTREFKKAERDTYRHILKSLPFDILSFEEKIAYRILKGEMRAINRALYPNLLVRVARNLIVSGARLVRDLVKLTANLLNTILASATSTNGIRPGMFKREPSTNRRITPSRQRQLAQAPEGVTIRQVPTAAQTVDKVTPRQYRKPRVVHINTATQSQRM